MSEEQRWDDCPAGLVAEMACRLRREHNHSQQVRLVLASLLLALFVGGYAIMIQRSETPQEALTCDQTAPLLADYQSGKLTPERTEQVRVHLSHCPACRERYHERFPTEAREPSTRPSVLASL